MNGHAGWDWYVLGAIVLLTLCSLLTRCGYFLFGDHFPLSENLRRALRYAPTAALIAIVLPELLPWAPGAPPQAGAKAVAAVIAVLVFLRTRSAVMVIVAGMVALWILQALF